MSNTKGKEIEFKYSADNIDFVEFSKLCENKKPTKILVTCGYDHFYGNKSKKHSFYRYRTGSDINQLTFKKKLSENDSFIRVEHNLNLSSHSNKEQVDSLCSELGYKYNTSIFKTCFIYFYEKYIAVLYICYDPEMKELGRFFELELNEEIVWDSMDKAWDFLLEVESDFAVLGVKERSRIKKSLWEMFKTID